ncbi:MAG: bifunctional folylpolyglutamate synthase/dihydrofolate synthase [Clostridia bacterium]|nr:bifunctional folylpolyglutamate synthase/dihydrofolate synthase [Clostridia bacterium]
MNYTEAVNFIHSIPKFRRPLGNKKLAKLLDHLGNPHKKLRFIHIAGTNGKGSTSAMTAEILIQSGYRTGLFTSPFLEIFNDRIRVDGSFISDDDIASYTLRVKTAMEENDAYVSEFAFVTAMALLYFYERQCDFVVLEVGMGGALDATNIIETSIVSVICKIGLDHTQYLGDTIEKIALEKCGIIRENGIVVSHPNETVRDIIQSRSADKHASLTFAENATITNSGFIYKGKQYKLSLKGTYQPQNAAVALEIISAMRKLGIKIPEKAVTDGLSLVKWGARFEFVTDNIIIDGAHNIDGIRALKHSLLSLNRDIILITAMMEDKDYNSCIREIAPIAKAVIATELDISRCVKAEKIAAIISSINISVTVNTNPEQALYDALHAAESGAYGKNTVICVCGSLFLAGETRKFFS